MTLFSKPSFVLVMAALAMSSGAAYAFDAAEPAAAALARLESIDCATQPDECRYYAAVETLSFADACPVAFERKFGEQDEKSVAKIKSWIDAWTALRPQALRTAALDPKNKLRLYLDGKSADYLSTLPSDELGIECSRIAVIKDGKAPEEQSGLLRETLNYEAWLSRRLGASTNAE
ncbi:hypothetical protein [Burkholderia sp. Ac-20365]|uniref:hypothetical protein n=1 Tax=Burkholderia sp. Ac-20365 TaxID=2703897 RepID=UPI00197C473A|nr:hypothetical protein [Burkholderia sp. Ac-20365]MBN3761168.1 hypothetical protein [Burkholderia sp. Ac-20365]